MSERRQVRRIDLRRAGQSSPYPVHGPTLKAVDDQDNSSRMIFVRPRLHAARGMKDMLDAMYDQRLGGIFGAGNFYIDLQRHLDAGEERLNRKLAALADAVRIPMVATNDVCHSGSDRQHPRQNRRPRSRRPRAGRPARGRR